MFTSTPTAATEATYLGNAACAGCHQQASAEWTDSHHDLAMQEATHETVLGNFNNATFDYFGVTTTFSQKGGRLFHRDRQRRGRAGDVSGQVCSRG